MIMYKKNKDVDFGKIINLYNACSWEAYTKDPEKLKRGIENSTFFVTAWEDDNLIGLARAISDKETILYIQDILVDPEFRSKGIGSKLLSKLLENTENIRQKVLIADDESRLYEFYKKNQFHVLDKYNIKCYGKFD